MAMNHGAGAGVAPINLKMQQQFAGAHTIAGQNISVEIREADIGRLHVALAHHGRCAEQVALAEPHTDVSAVAVDILPLPQLAADSNDLHA